MLRLQDEPLEGKTTVHLMEWHTGGQASAQRISRRSMAAWRKSWKRPGPNAQVEKAEERKSKRMPRW